MANEFMEPEEFGNEQVGMEYDPMGTPINEKPYTKPNVKINPQDLQGDIPEPSFTPPVIDLGEPKLEAPAQPKKEREPFNKEMNDLPKRDKEVAASHVANMIMQLYEGANAWANKGMIFNEKKISIYGSEVVKRLIEMFEKLKVNDTFYAHNLTFDGSIIIENMGMIGKLKGVFFRSNIYEITI